MILLDILDAQTRKNSIQIYHYRKGRQLTYDKIEEKITNESVHRYPIRLKTDEEVRRYTTFKFTKVTSNNNNKDLLWYSVDAEREILNEDSLLLHHNVCFSKKGFLIITGMTHRDALLRYLADLLHPGKHVFEPKYFTKKEIEDFTNKLLKKDVNIIYRPRFHFSDRYRNNIVFSDFAIGENECATNYNEYPKMIEKCFYFEPIFKICKINDETINTRLKLNHAGRFYSSYALSFEQWVAFVKTYLSWCL